TAISQFPDLIVQNEKNAGAYRTLISVGHLAGARGTRRSADDLRRGEAIERLLCVGVAKVDEATMEDLRPTLAPFVARGLARCGSDWVAIEADGLSYARAIASSLDGYRAVSKGTFSHAV
ncbi:MAG: hemN, partial [Rhizorhabdus sp.]|nr:hemN [Rhizorhabdus sp.]